MIFIFATFGTDPIIVSIFIKLHAVKKWFRFFKPVGHYNIHRPIAIATLGIGPTCYNK